MKCDADGVIMKTFFRSPYNYDMGTVSRETQLVCPEVTRTQQQFKEECDINNILRLFGVTGNLPITTVQPMTGDFTSVGDYQDAMNAVVAADENFMRLPALVREKFGQDPKQFVDFCVDPANIEAVRDLGLAPRPVAPTLTELEKKT